MTYAIVTVIVLIADQLLKFWTTKNIPLLPANPTAEQIAESVHELIPGFIHLTNIHNNGAAFSILEGARWFFVILTLVFVVAVVVLISQEIIRGSLGRWSAVLVMAGAISNGLDRALYGYVVDMFEFEFMNFAIFNLADIFITVCGILFCVYILFEKPSPEEMAAGQSGGLLVMLKSSRRSARVPSRASHSPSRREREAEPDAVAVRSDDEPVRRSRSERRSRREASPLDNIPKRGEHRSLADELSTIDSADPFAEWNNSPAESEPTAEEPTVPAEPAPKVAPEKDDSLSFGDDLSFDLEDILSEFGHDE